MHHFHIFSKMVQTMMNNLLCSRWVIISQLVDLMSVLNAPCHNASCFTCTRHVPMSIKLGNLTSSNVFTSSVNNFILTLWPSTDTWMMFDLSIYLMEFKKKLCMCGTDLYTLFQLFYSPHSNAAKQHPFNTCTFSDLDFHQTNRNELWVVGIFFQFAFKIWC